MLQKIHIEDADNLAVGNNTQISMSENQVIMDITPFMNNI